MLPMTEPTLPLYLSRPRGSVGPTHVSISAATESSPPTHSMISSPVFTLRPFNVEKELLARAT